MTACPSCSGPMLTGSDGGVRYEVCSQCRYSVRVGEVARAVVTAPPKRPEAKLVHAICQELERRGYTVLRVGQHVAAGSGTTTGTPDLFVTHPAWQRWAGPVWIGIEVKTDTGQLTPEQADLARDCGVPTVRSVEEAVKVVTRGTAA